MLNIHRSERADGLVHALAGILADPPADPFTRELVAVPTRGMERWLTQRLSLALGTSPQGRDGVCAAVDFPFPSRLLAEALAVGSGIDPDRDPWSPDRLVWPLMEVAAERLGEDWLAPLAGHLGSGDGRRYSRLRHLAGLYDHYALNRPELIASWIEGSGGRSVAERWQSELWRALRQRIDLPSGPERLSTARERLIADPTLVDLPGRLVFFGLTRLASAHVQLLTALAAAREVHLMLLHPSPALWEAVARESRPTAAPIPDTATAITGHAIPAATPRPRAEDPTVGLARHRLLASWGTDARELQLVLSGTGAAGGDLHHPANDPPGTPPSLLAAIQADIRADRPPPGPPLLAGEEDRRLTLVPEDTSIRLHACHGRARQVAVLREAILHRLADDDTLEPRDIIVMCPEVEEFAPLIQAAFGSIERAEGDLRVRLADRSLRQTNPLLSLAAQLLELASARLTASEVLDLIDAPPVRRRFHLSDDDVARLRGWVVEARIHWGLDGEHRSAWKLGGVEAGTWLRGVRRLLLGAAVAEGGTELFGGALPAGTIDSNDIELVGALAELIDRLATVVDRLSGPQSVANWVSALADSVDALAAVSDQDVWQRQELTGLLEAVAADAGGRADLGLSHGEARALLAERLRGRPTRANFRTGHLTVCTLHPMRSVPHRVVCLLGLDDQAFPRHAPRDGDDLLGAQPCVGDRDARSEDRQLMLDALMAAEEALIITYSGNDERTNAPLPPAVPVGELLDVIEATARPESDRDSGTGGLGLTGPASSARQRVLTRHPLQAFDPRNFTSGALERGVTWSFDRVALTGAHTLAAGSPQPVPAFLSAPLGPAPDEELVALADLIAFVQWPARAFLRQRLGVSVARWDDEVRDAMPVDFGGLESWGVGQRLLDAILAGADWDAARDAERARGTLPPGELGRPILELASRRVERIATQARVFTVADPRTFETNVLLSERRRLTGTVSGIHDQTLLSVGYSTLGARHRLSAWVRLLVLNATHPDVPWEAVTMGRGGRDSVAVARISALAGSAQGRQARARAELESLLALRAEGLTRPLVIPAKTAEAFVAAQAVGQDAERAADKQWTSGFRSEREDAEAEHQLVFGRELPLTALGRDAPRLWTALREHERLEYA